MSDVADRYLKGALAKSSPPHKADSEVWGRRPLSADVVSYAATDVHVIASLYKEMQKVKLSVDLTTAVIIHSKIYEDTFRSATESMLSRKDFVLEEHAIVGEETLPNSHPKRQPMGGTSPLLTKWNEAVESLSAKNSNSSKAFSLVQFILQHDDWYTDEGRREIRRLAASFPFTSNQRNKIATPPALQRERDRYDDDDDY
jgi:hypothetical protein